MATTGLEAIAVKAQGGGDLTISGTTVTTTNDASKGLAVFGGGSTLTASNLTVTTSGTTNAADGDNAEGVFNGSGNGYTGGGTALITNSAILTHGDYAVGVDTENGGLTTINGGSINTTGNAAYAVSVDTGGVVKLTGTTIGTTGNGSGGLAIHNTGSEIDATNVTITTLGGFDSVSGQHSYGVYNGPFGSYPTGGVAKITNSSISTQGTLMYGVYTSTGGATTLNGTSVSTTGIGALGLLSDNGGTTNVTGGTISTTGAAAYAVAVNHGAAISLNGTMITATGLGSGGLGINGAASTLNATGVTVSTMGGFDPVSGQNAYGVYNGPYGDLPSGGTASLTNSSVATSAAQMVGVYTGVGGTTTLAGTSVTTGGVGAAGVELIAGGVTNVSGSSVTTAGQDAHAPLCDWRRVDGQSQRDQRLHDHGRGRDRRLCGARRRRRRRRLVDDHVTTSGGVSPATGLGAYGVNADGAGSSVTLGAATITTSGPGAYGLLASDAAGSGTAGSITATGTLNVKTTNAGATAVGLVGNGATILATGGGTITSTGTAVSLSGGANQTATFDNFTINNLSGDLVFADPSSSTVNFNSTTANAGTNPLFYATGAGTVATLNANGSTLTGTIQTGPGAISNVNLSNHTTWNLTGPSTVTNLNVTNSIIVFAPPGSGSGFKTLTVTNYVGSGAMITMNATLGGSTSGSDQIIVNGGKATGSTLLTINNFGGLGGATSGAGIPLVFATNGGTVAPGAFALANTPLVGGFRYMLQESNNDWYLVSTPAPTSGQVQSSVNQVAKAQQTQIVTNRVLNSLLLGATQQISCTSCAGGFASIGSFAAGAEGRWGLSDELTLIGGLSYNQWYASGISVENAPTVAGSLIYDLWKWGESRPFFQVGGALTPYEDVYYTRYYANGLTTAVGNASAIDRDLSLFARAGWIDRFSPIDEAAVYGDLGRDWLQTGGYTEMTSFLNPFPATVRNGLDTLNVAHLGGQWTHLFNGNIEANVTAAVAYGFGAGDSAATSVLDFGPIAPSAIANTTWMEWGARLGYRFNNRVVIDAFVVGTAFGQIGTTVHGGVGLRYEF